MPQEKQQRGLFPDWKETKPVDPRLEIINFHPGRVRSTDQRLNDAKLLLDEYKSAQQQLIVKSLKDLIEQLQMKRSKKVKEVQSLLDRFVQDGFLPTSSGAVPNFKQYKGVLSLAMLKPLLERVRLAYSDLITEAREAGNIANAEKLEAEAAAFFDKEQFKFNGNVEAIDELYIYDYELVMNWFVAGRLFKHGPKFSEAREREWVVATVGEGLALHAESPTAPLWVTLVNVYRTRRTLEIKGGAVAKILLDAQSPSALVDPLTAVSAIFASEQLREEIVDNEGRVIQSKETESSDATLQVAFDAMTRAESRVQQYIAADKLHDEIWKRYDDAILPLKNSRKIYYQRRKIQHDIK